MAHPLAVEHCMRLSHSFYVHLGCTRAQCHTSPEFCYVS